MTTKQHPAATSLRTDERFDVTVVLPCLNEAETIAACIQEIQRSLSAANLHGEIIVSDNGSVDGSASIAVALGAKVVQAYPAGYGVALAAGIAAATAENVVIGDADGSYDFGDIPKFLDTLDSGFDVVIGNRFRGGVMAGAMPWSHRWIGNPVLTAIGRILFQCTIGDFHCGLRAIRKQAFTDLRLQRPGMEFASEMIVRARLEGLRITEIPTVLRPDGRSRPPHLRSFRDGWRHLRFMLFFCPLWLFLIPGASLMLAGVTLQLILAISGGLDVRGIHFGVNSSLASIAIILLGLQLIGSGLLVRTTGQSAGILPLSKSDSRNRVLIFKLGLLLAGILASIGITLFLSAINQWRVTAFGDLSSSLTLCRVIPAVTLMTVGAQVTLFAMLISVIEFLAGEPCSSHRSK